MSADRIPCPQCGSMILPVTAKFNAGLCAPCNRTRERDAIEAEREKYRRNPPKTEEEVDKIAPPGSSIGFRIFLMGLLPLKLEPSKFTKKNFLTALGEIVSDHQPSGEKVSIEFLGLCDPVLHDGGSLTTGLKRLPRPYREAMAVYQLWGMMTSNGLESYLESTDRAVDAEVDRGLKLFERSDSLGLAANARKKFDPCEGLPDGLEDELEDVLYRDLDSFEEKVLGPFLIQTLTKA